MASSDWFATPESVISFTSMIASWAAAMFAWSSAQSARREIKILRQQELAKDLQLMGSLGRAYYELKGDEFQYIFPILVRNPSEVENAIARAELWIGYRRQGENRHVAKVPHDNRIGVDIKKSGESALILPAVIDIRETISGAIGFAVPAGFLEESEILDFVLRLEDTRGRAVELPQIFVEARDHLTKAEETE